MHRKLMDCPSDAQKFDRSCGNVHTPIGPSLNFLCIHRIIRRLPSNFCVSEQLSVNLPHISGIFLQLLSTCHASVGLSVNFHECSVHPWDFTSILHASVNFCCASWGLVPTFLVSAGPSASFCQLSVRLQYHPSSFSAPAGYSVNVSCVHRTFCKLT